jgi:hypothetical protein
MLNDTLARPLSPIAAPTKARGLNQKPIHPNTSFELASVERREVCAISNNAAQKPVHRARNETNQQAELLPFRQRFVGRVAKRRNTKRLLQIQHKPRAEPQLPLRKPVFSQVL